VVLRRRKMGLEDEVRGGGKVKVKVKVMW